MLVASPTHPVVLFNILDVQTLMRYQLPLELVGELLVTVDTLLKNSGPRNKSLKAMQSIPDILYRCLK